MKNYCLFFLLLLANATFVLAMETSQTTDIDKKYLKQLTKQFQNLSFKKDSESIHTTLTTFIKNELNNIKQPVSPKSGSSFRSGSKINKNTSVSIKQLNTLTNFTYSYVQSFIKKQKETNILSESEAKNIQDDIKQAIQIKEFSHFIDLTTLDGGTLSDQDEERYIKRKKSLRKSISNLLTKKS